MNRKRWSARLLFLGSVLALAGCTSDIVVNLDNQVIPIDAANVLDEVRLEGALLPFIEIEPDFQGNTASPYNPDFDQYSVECNLVAELPYLLVWGSAGASLNPIIPKSTTFHFRSFAIENFAIDLDDPTSILSGSEHLDLDFKIGIAEFSDAESATDFMSRVKAVSQDCGSLKEEVEWSDVTDIYEVAVVELVDNGDVLALKTSRGFLGPYRVSTSYQFLISRYGNLLVISQSSFDAEALRYFDLTEENLLISMESISAQVETSILESEETRG